MTDTLKFEAGNEYLLRNGWRMRCYATDGGDERHGAANGGGRGAFLDELINLALGTEADQYEFYDGYVAEWLRGVKAKRAKQSAMRGQADKGALP